MSHIEALLPKGAHYETRERSNCRYHRCWRSARRRRVGDRDHLFRSDCANGTSVATYAEGGFTATTTLGQFFQGQAFGNPVPSLFAGPAQGGPVNDALDVTRNGGGSFDLASVDLAANNGNVSFILTGFLGGMLKYVFNGVEPGRPPGPFGFDTIINPDAGIAIDDARIALDIMGTTGNVDNIVVDAVTTPEPASILLLGSALIGIGVWRKRKLNARRSRSVDVRLDAPPNANWCGR